MTFTETDIAGVWLIDSEPIRDERGMFMRTWCHREFEAHGLQSAWVQSSVSVNNRKGTMRGLHYQSTPQEEVKLVRCTTGAIYDVVVDLRPASPTYCRHIGITLSAENGRAVYIPRCCAHGYITLEAKSEVSYCISEFYEPSSARGVRWDDPAFKITWPVPIAVMSEKDRTWPAFLKDSVIPS